MKTQDTVSQLPAVYRSDLSSDPLSDVRAAWPHGCKLAVILFHADLHKIYKPRWIKKCLDSLFGQTYNTFEIFELNYGKEFQGSILEGYNIGGRIHRFWRQPMPGYAAAMNFLLDRAFLDFGMDVVANVNLDDYYSSDRFARELPLVKIFSVVSSNFYYIREEPNGVDDKVFHRMEMSKFAGTQANVIKNMREVNFISHPSVCFNRSFWRRYPDIIYMSEPRSEDWGLWKRAINYSDITFAISSHFLCFYRRHDGQIVTRGEDH